MPGTVKCPGCGAAIPAGRGGVVACAHCGEAWAPCRRCRFYLPVTAECGAPHLPEPRRLTDADQLMSCCRLPAPAVRKWPIAATLTVALVVAVGLWVATAAYRRLEEPAAPELSMRIPLTRPTQVGQPYQLAVCLFNPSRVGAEEVSLAIERSYLGHFEVESIDPPPQRITTRRRTVVYTFGSLPAGGDLEVLIELRPLVPGRWRGRVILGSRGRVSHRAVLIATQVVP